MIGNLGCRSLQNVNDQILNYLILRHLSIKGQFLTNICWTDIQVRCYQGQRVNNWSFFQFSILIHIFDLKVF